MFTRDRTPEIYRSLADTFGVPAKEIAALARFSTLVDVAADEVLINEGVTGHEVLIVLDGEVVVSRHGTEVARLGTGAVIGEQALLTNGPRNATVTTTVATTLAVLNRAEFSTILDTCPALSRRVLTVAIDRLLPA